MGTKQFSNNQIKDFHSINHNRPLRKIIESDCRVQGLADFIDLKNKKVLDIGSLDGYHSCQLSMLGAIVTCSDIRPVNLAKSLYRCLFHGITNTTFRILDMETMHEEIDKDEFDIIFHSGCFYHLENPVKHLFNISKLAKYMLLETHIANPDKYEKGVLETYEGTLYPEGEWSDTQAAKDSKKSFWLREESLKKLIGDCGLKIVKTVYERKENPHGPRVCYILERL